VIKEKNCFGLSDKKSSGNIFFLKKYWYQSILMGPTPKKHSKDVKITIV